MLVGVCDALVVFLFELVFVGVGIRIAATPELFDKAFALVVSGQFLECLTFFVGDDVSDVLIEPIFVSLFEFGLYIAGFSAGVLLILSKNPGAGTENQGH